MVTSTHTNNPTFAEVGEENLREYARRRGKTVCDLMPRGKCMCQTEDGAPCEKKIAPIIVGS